LPIVRLVYNFTGFRGKMHSPYWYLLLDTLCSVRMIVSSPFRVSGLVAVSITAEEDVQSG
jgi:hypothetical protein